MKVLVTGNQGFIGRHVSRLLRNSGHEVIGLDIVGNPEIKADIREALPKIEKVDVVIHLAAVANPRMNTADPPGAFNTNVQGTDRVLQWAVASQAKKVLFASSAHVYGISPKYLPTDENHPLWFQNNQGVTQIYTLTKILGERLCELYYENFGLNYTSLRLFNAYGEGQALGYFVPDMMAKAQDGYIELTDGSTTKDWIHVEDVARAFLRGLDTPFVGTVNIGTGRETDLGTIASRIASAYGASHNITPANNPTRMCADVSRAQQVLGWQPQIGLGEGLERTLSITPTKA